MNWITKYFTTPPQRWTSVLIMFYDEEQLVVDKGYVFLGKVPRDYLGYYCNMSNFSIIDNRLFYCYSNGMVKRIDPEKVFIHLKFGKGPMEPYHWSTFFSSSRNELIQLTKSYINAEVIKVFDTQKNSSKSLKPSNAEHPLFLKKQIYGNEYDQVVLSNLKIYVM